MAIGTIRVYELARELKTTSKELIEVLGGLGVEVSSHMNTVTDETALAVRELLMQGDSKKADGTKPKAKATKKPEAKKPEEKGKKQVDGADVKGAKKPAKAKGPAKGRGEEPEDDHGKKAPRRRDEHPSRGRQDDTSEDAEDADASRRGRRPARRPSQDPEGRGPDHREQPSQPRELVLGDTVAVKDLAVGLNRPVTAVIKRLLLMGVIANVNQAVDYETAARVASEFGFNVRRDTGDQNRVGLRDTLAEELNPEMAKGRSPVVTVMGHVDHGKTSVLDKIREEKVTETEAGGITQHIGAYEVDWKGKNIVFLDTPGHEAFTAMRARGAQVTDIVVLVVAADDGVMPQTIEAINHVKAAGVPMIVAINKMDVAGANPDKVMRQLTEYNLVPEAWGGDTVCVSVSAITGEGIEDLLEYITLMAEMEELKANPDEPARGTIVEAELDKGRGPVATVIVQTGTLRVGDAITAGFTHGKVRALIDDKGDRLDEAGPATPVEVLGLGDVPRAGDILEVHPDDKTARDSAETRVNAANEQAHKRRQVTLDGVYQQIKEGDIKELKVVLKADVHGSVEAVQQSLEKLKLEDVTVKVIHGGVGAISESDVLLAAASGAIIIGFNVRPDRNASDVAETEGVDIRTYRVIYNLLQDIEAALVGLLDPEFKEVVLGQAEVRAVFKVPRAGNVAGCYIRDGRVISRCSIRVIRDGIVVHEGPIDSLRRFKDDVREVTAGYECGIGIERFNDIKEGDVLEAFHMEEVERG